MPQYIIQTSVKTSTGEIPLEGKPSDTEIHLEHLPMLAIGKREARALLKRIESKLVNNWSVEKREV
jgi:hypothetical protein